MARAASRDLTLQNKSKQEASEADAWRGICSSGCYRAKTDKKKCKCHGEHHGKERTDQLEENKITQYCQQEEPA
jgi:hypothetical protein